MRRIGLAWVWPLAVAAGAMWLYVRTLAPGTVYFQDVAEFQTKLYTLDVIHATGYPYYQVLGKIWLTLLPVGSIAWRVNLYSALWAAVALACLGLILQRARVRPWAIVGACAVLACSQSFWSYSILASTYTMHVALVALATLTLLRWQDGGSLAWFALACGVGLAHHRLFIIALPAFAIISWIEPHTRRLFGRQWVKLGFWVGVPLLLSWGWLAIIGVWPLETLWRYLFAEGQQYVGHVSGLGAWVKRLTDRVLPWLVEPYGLFPTLLAIAGCFAWLWSGACSLKRRVGIALLAQGIGVMLFFSLFWINPDDRRYFLTADWALAGGWALAWDGLWSNLSVRLRRREFRWGAQVGFMALAFIPVVELYSNNLDATVNLRDGYADRVSRELLATVESDATVFGDWILAWPLRYFHEIEDLRPDVRIIVDPGDAYRDTATALARQGARVYFRQPMYGLDWADSGFEWAPLAVGHLSRALPVKPSLAHVQDAGQSFAGDVSLGSIGFSQWPLRPDTFVRLVFQWSGAESVDPNTGVSLRLDDAEGRTRWRFETTWQKLGRHASAETDVYWITPPTLAPGDYTLVVALYDHETLETLGEARVGPILAVAGEPLPAGRLVLENSVDACSRTADICLLGYGFLERETWIGHAVPLSIFWRASRVPDAPVTVLLALDGNGQRHVVHDACRVPVPYPSALIETPCPLLPPDTVKPGRYTLVAVVGSGAETWEATLTSMQVRDRSRVFRAPSMQVRLPATLGDEIALLGYDVSPAPVWVGQTLELTLYWQALQPGRANYKVFTHLIGPDGTPVSQHDSLPAKGAAPTQRWVEGEIVADRHPIPIPGDAPAGEYEVYVGLYVPETGDRLPAWDEKGVPFLNNAIPLRPVTIQVEQ